MKTLSVGNYAGQNRRQYKIPGLTFTNCYFAKAFNSDWHRHENSHLTLCLKGTSIEKRKNHDIICSPGLLLLYPSGMLHRNTDYVSVSQSFSIEFDNEWCKKYRVVNQEKNRQNVIVDPLVKMHILKMMKEANEPDAHSNLSLETSMLGILTSFNNERSDKRPSWITALFELLHDEHNTRWSLASLSEKLNIHPVTISKYFPKYFNATIGDYIRKIKTKKALGDLCKRSISLDEIALKCGFVDNAHFTRVFKTNTGMTPSAYRQFITS